MGQVVLGLNYFKTWGGKLKFIEIVLNIIAGCLVGLGYTGQIVNFFLSATIIACIVSIVILVFHVFKLLRTDPAKSEFLANLFMFIYYLAACVVLINSYVISGGETQFVFGKIFGVFAVVCYLIDTGYCFWQDPFCFKRN